MIPRSFNIGIIWLLAQVGHSRSVVVPSVSLILRCTDAAPCAQVNFGASFSLRQPFTTEVLADFPTSLQFWHGGESLFLGSGIKYKTIVFIHIQARSEALTAASGGSHWQCKLSRNVSAKLQEVISAIGLCKIVKAVRLSDQKLVCCRYMK